MELPNLKKKSEGTERKEKVNIAKSLKVKQMARLKENPKEEYENVMTSKPHKKMKL